MSGWETSRFKAHFEIGLRNGLTKPSRVRGSGLPMVNMKEIFGYDVIADQTPMELVPVTEKEMESSLLECDDLLFARQSLVESGAGKVSIFKGNLPTVFESHLIRCRIDKKKSDPNFIYYLFKSHIGKGAVSTIVHQVAAAGIKGSDLQELEFAFPLLAEQKAIAAILSSLDDKIDLLHRQNQTLEAMAATLFRQWFVEEAQEDWEERPLSSWGAIVCGKTPSKSETRYFGGDIPFIKIPDMHGQAFICQTADSLTPEGRDTQPKKTIQAGAICVSCIATVGLVSMTTTESQTNQQINSIVPEKDEYRYFLFLFMKSSYDVLHAMASGGTATLNLNTGNFSTIAIPFPGEALLENFHSIAAPIFQKVFKNQMQIQTLEKLRDTLLPKLMSGEVRVAA